MGKRIPTYVMNPSRCRASSCSATWTWTRASGSTACSLPRRARWCAASEVKSWIICDGDIDPEWVESLNSVLDDNRLLTMPSGERIQFGPNVNFLFETHDLKFASPATVCAWA